MASQKANFSTQRQSCIVYSLVSFCSIISSRMALSLSFFLISSRLYCFFVVISFLFFFSSLFFFSLFFGGGVGGGGCILIDVILVNITLF